MQYSSRRQIPPKADAREQEAAAKSSEPVESAALPGPAAPPRLREAALPASPLDPGRLDAQALDAVRRIHAEGEADNTRRAYQAALRYWLAWFSLRYGQELTAPVHPATVAQFVVDHVDAAADQPRQLPVALQRALVEAGFAGAAVALPASTLALRLAALSRWHRDQGLASPCDDEAVRVLLSRLRRGQAKQGAAPRKKDALDAAHMQAVLATCDGSPQGVRDRALLAFGFATGGRRRSEIVAADFAQLSAAGDGYRFRLGYAKTNQDGRERPEDLKPLQGEAARALTAWLELMDDQGVAREGKLFRQVNKGGRIGSALTPAAVRLIVQRRCEMAGLAVAGFSAHSLRAGFLTEAGRKGVPIRDAMAMSGHSSVATALGYMRVGELERSPAAKLLG